MLRHHGKKNDDSAKFINEKINKNAKYMCATYDIVLKRGFKDFNSKCDNSRVNVTDPFYHEGRI